MTQFCLVDGMGYTSKVETMGPKHQPYCPKPRGDSRADVSEQVEGTEQIANTCNSEMQKRKNQIQREIVNG